MAQQQISIKSWTGGIANDVKVGIPNSVRFFRNLDIYQDASYITPSPKTAKVSSTTVTNLPLWGIDASPYNTNRYFYDLGGNIYQCTSSDTFSNLRTVSGSQGQGLGLLDDYLYYAGNITLGRYGRLSGTPAFTDNFLADNTTDLDQSQALTGNTYAVPTSISETATNRQTFTPQYDPINRISVYVVDKGTGNWTITVHDAANNNLGSATIANASLTNSALNVFTFSTQIRDVIGNSYHFHVTSTQNDGTLRSGTSNDLETSTYNDYFGILIAATYHPILSLLNGIVIGNDNYLAFWDQATYNPNKVQLEYGYHVRSIARVNEFVIAGAWKGSSESNVEDARLYFWDGISPTFNYSIPVSQGLPNALASIDNRLIGVYGETGELFVDTAPFQLVHETPNLGQNKTIEIAPGAMSPYQARMAVGYTFSNDDATGVQNGVYVYGNRTDQFPDVLSFPFTISTGNVQATNLKIGMVLGVGNDLYIGWREGSTYGVDKVTKTNGPFTSGEMYSLIFDNDMPQKPKYADVLVVEFEPLVANETVTPKFAIDGNAYSNTFTSGTAQSTVGATQAVMSIGRRFKEISFGFNFTTSTTFLKITGMYLMFDDLAEERGY